MVEAFTEERFFSAADKRISPKANISSGNICPVETLRMLKMILNNFKATAGPKLMK